MEVDGTLIWDDDDGVQRLIPLEEDFLQDLYPLQRERVRKRPEQIRPSNQAQAITWNYWANIQVEGKKWIHPSKWPVQYQELIMTGRTYETTFPYYQVMKGKRYVQLTYEGAIEMFKWLVSMGMTPYLARMTVLGSGQFTPALKKELARRHLELMRS